MTKSMWIHHYYHNSSNPTGWWLTNTNTHVYLPSHLTLFSKNISLLSRVQSVVAVSLRATAVSNYCSAQWLTLPMNCPHHAIPPPPPHPFSGVDEWSAPSLSQLSGVIDALWASPIQGLVRIACRLRAVCQTGQPHAISCGINHDPPGWLHSVPGKPLSPFQCLEGVLCSSKDSMESLLWVITVVL